MGVLGWIRTPLVAAVAVAVAIVLAVPAGASPDSDKARIDRELARATDSLEAATANAQQAAASYEAAILALPGAQSVVAEAAGRVAAAEAAVRTAAREAEAARIEQAGADEALAGAAAKVENARLGVARFAAATYKGGGVALLDSVVAARSPNEFAERIGYLDKVAENRRTAVDSLTASRGLAREQRSVAAAANRRAQDAAAGAEQALARSRAAATAAEQAAGRVQALVTQREAAVATANAERGAVLAKYDELQAESARVAAELRAAANRQPSVAGPAISADAYFTMPVRGRKTSNFGRRFHPLFHHWTLHSGMDIAAGSGSPIVAAADGEVVRAGYSGGSGNYTCVHHGRHQGAGLATCYAHQSQILVRVGQRVGRGQLIGRVGNTGNSTGPHLHFEVRLGGGPVDPAKWLPACLC